MNAQKAIGMIAILMGFIFYAMEEGECKRSNSLKNRLLPKSFKHEHRETIKYELHKKSKKNITSWLSVNPEKLEELEGKTVLQKINPGQYREVVLLKRVSEDEYLVCPNDEERMHLAVWHGVCNVNVLYVPLSMLPEKKDELSKDAS